MTRSLLSTALLLVLVMLAGACGGGDDTSATDDAADTTDTSDIADVADTADDTDTAEAPVPPAPDADEVAADELPQFDSDFDRVCTTQVGFGGATSYEPTPGIHPVLLFQETDSGSLITSSVDLPAGWAIEQDSDFDDNSELKPIELVACAVIGGQSPNGVTCDFESDDETITLNLVDTKFEVTIHSAKTGAVLGTETIEAASERCPTVAFIDEGQTDYVNKPDAEQYTNVLRPYVMPG